VVYSRERKVYDLLAFIGDCGGLYGGLLAIFQAILSVLNMITGDPLQESLVKRVYRKPAVKKEKGSTVFSGINLGLCSKRKLVGLGYDRIEQELEIGKFLIKFIMMWNQVKTTIKPEQLVQLRYGRRLSLKQFEKDISPTHSETSDANLTF